LDQPSTAAFFLAMQDSFSYLGLMSWGKGSQRGNQISKIHTGSFCSSSPSWQIFYRSLPVTLESNLPIFLQKVPFFVEKWFWCLRM